jgi:hypothetical protein
MRNKLGSSLGSAALILMVASLTVFPVVAQDDDTDSGDKAHVLLEIDAWAAYARGLEYEPATVANPSRTLGDTIIEFDPESATDVLYKFEVDAGKNVGRFRVTWFSQTLSQDMTMYTPGDFWFGQIQSHPAGAGWLNDGRADGFESSTQTKLSDLRFDFMRTAFQTDRFEGRWFVGLRRVQHDRDLYTTYYALAPLLPPVLPPLYVDPETPERITPYPEGANVSSDYRGRGLQGGMELDIWVIKDRLKFESGLGVGVLSGQVDTSYYSRNWVYVFTDPLTEEVSILSPPYPFDEIIPLPGANPPYTTVGDNTVQTQVDTGLQSSSRSTVSPVLDLFVGLRGRVWKGIELALGYRSLFLGNVGVDLRPKVSSVTVAGSNFVDVTETERSAEYNGFYMGLGYRF